MVRRTKRLGNLVLLLGAWAFFASVALYLNYDRFPRSLSPILLSVAFTLLVVGGGLAMSNPEKSKK